MMWRPNSIVNGPPLFRMRPFNFIALAALVVMLASAAFGQTAGVKGTVKAQNGKGIANASVLVRRDGKDVKSTRADSKGQFSITGLSEGKYNVVFDADGYETGVFYNVELANGSVRDLGDRLILSVDRGTQVIVIGSVFSKEGYVLPGAKVTVERIRPDGKAKSIGKGYTNESG